MKKYLQILLTSAVVLASGSAALAQLTIDARIGTAPPPPRAFRVPPRPGPEFAWVEGYWWPQGSRWMWHDGYWSRPPYTGAFWVPPYWQGGQFVAGRWMGPRGNVFHDHRWDRNTNRDWNHNPSRGR